MINTLKGQPFVVNFIEFPFNFFKQNGHRHTRLSIQTLSDFVSVQYASSSSIYFRERFFHQRSTARNSEQQKSQMRSLSVTQEQKTITTPPSTPTSVDTHPRSAYRIKHITTQLAYNTSPVPALPPHVPVVSSAAQIPVNSSPAAQTSLATVTTTSSAVLTFPRASSDAPQRRHPGLPPGSRRPPPTSRTSPSASLTVKSPSSSTPSPVDTPLLTAIKQQSENVSQNHDELKQTLKLFRGEVSNLEALPTTFFEPQPSPIESTTKKNENYKTQKQSTLL